MITIYAEKPDVGTKIAAALDCITLSSGKKVDFKDIKNNSKAITAQRSKDGYFKINWKGHDCYVTWGYGHLCELKQARDYNLDYKNWSKMPLPFIPPKYELKLKSSAKKQFNIVKRLFEKSKLIINATDPDREGEVIFDYVYRQVGASVPFMRAHFTSQTKEGIIDAFNHLKNAKDIVNVTLAGRGRNIADWVIGSNLTAAMTLKYKSKEVLSLGRVQTPTLNMIVKRQKEIDNFKSEPFYTISATFTTKFGETYTANHSNKRFNNKADADSVMKKIEGKNGVVTEINKKEILKYAPNLYSLSSLQMDANARYGFTLAQTLKLAQSLYDGGYITYPRSDSEFLTEDMEPVINKVLDQLATIPAYEKHIKGKARRFNKAKYFNDAKVSSHYAIVPTGNIPSGIKPNEGKLYDLIVRSVIAMLYGPAKLEQTAVKTDVEGEAFISKGNSIKELSWMELFPRKKDTFLPNLAEKDVVSGEFKQLKKYTEPPKKYTDKTLISAMISCGKDLEEEELKKIMADPNVAGIGTPATRAAIIERLIELDYIKRQGKSIIATQKGIDLIDALPLEDIKSAKLTALWESKLNDIESGKYSFDSFIKDIEDTARAWCKDIYSNTPTTIPKSLQSAFNNNLGVDCPSCGKGIKKFSWGWGCSGYKDGCKFAISSKFAGKKLTDNQVKGLIKNGSTAKLKGFKSKKGKPFEARLTLDKDKKIVFCFD